jgi:ubiquinol-cytochrome c reductase cytochrome c subunit
MRAVVRSFAIALGVLALLTPPQGPPIVPTGGAGAKPPVQLGEELFAGNCSTCHGSRGEGVPPSHSKRGGSAINGTGPSLKGVGARAADFYLRTGYMPLADARDQPERSRPRVSERDIRALVAYVGSLGDGPPIPQPHPAGVGEGRELFTEHCAGCHQAVAEGGIMPGAKAPPLDRATPTQIAEAVRIGPYAMPPFSERAISDDELDAIIAYVQYTKDPQDAGGWGISHLGPFPEGMVTWLIAVVVLVATCMVIGKRRSSS